MSIIEDENIVEKLVKCETDEERNSIIGKYKKEKAEEEMRRKIASLSEGIQKMNNIFKSLYEANFDFEWDFKGLNIEQPKTYEDFLKMREKLNVAIMGFEVKRCIGRVIVSVETSTDSIQQKIKDHISQICIYQK